SRLTSLVVCPIFTYLLRLTEVFPSAMFFALRRDSSIPLAVRGPGQTNNGRSSSTGGSPWPGCRGRGISRSDRGCTRHRGCHYAISISGTAAPWSCRPAHTTVRRRPSHGGWLH